MTLPRGQSCDTVNLEFVVDVEDDLVVDVEDANDDDDEETLETVRSLTVCEENDPATMMALMTVLMTAVMKAPMSQPPKLIR